MRTMKRLCSSSYNTPKRLMIPAGLVNSYANIALFTRGFRVMA